MKKLLVGLGIATGVALLVLVGFWIGSAFRGPIGEARADDSELQENSPPITRSRLADPPPPPPPPPKNEVRIKNNLMEGKTYLVTTNFKLKMKASHKDWGLQIGINVHYEGFAEVERFIEKNDGKFIRELRTFKKVQTASLETTLDNVNVNLGVAGDLVNLGAAAFNPKIAMVGKTARSIVEGRNLAPLLEKLGLDQTAITHYIQQDPKMKVLSQAGQLQGKQVRLTYDVANPKEQSVESVVGNLTGEEQRFLMSSVLLADSMIFPDLEVKKGESWPVDASCFFGLLDPSMLIRPTGSITVRRGQEDVAVPGKKTRFVPIEVVSGEMTFYDCNRKAEQSGQFAPNPGSTLLFSREDQIIVEGSLTGRGRLNIRSKDHLLFERMTDTAPEITMQYNCKLR